MFDKFLALNNDNDIFAGRQSYQQRPSTQGKVRGTKDFKMHQAVSTKNANTNNDCPSLGSLDIQSEITSA